MLPPGEPAGRFLPTRLPGVRHSHLSDLELYIESVRVKQTYSQREGQWKQTKPSLNLYHVQYNREGLYSSYIVNPNVGLIL